MGSAPHVGGAGLGRFYDTFIGPRQIGFDLRADFVDGVTVVRDLTLDIRMSAAVRMRVPTVLVYRIDDRTSELKISSLQAYWELPVMVRQFARQGIAALPAGVALIRALLANQGVGGVIGLARGFRRPGRRARAAVRDLVAALSSGDELSIRRILGRADVGPPGGLPTERLRGTRADKVLAAGRSVTVSLTSGGSEPSAVLVVDFSGDGAIAGVRCFA